MQAMGVEHWARAQRPCPTVLAPALPALAAVPAASVSHGTAVQLSDCAGVSHNVAMPAAAGDGECTLLTGNGGMPVSNGTASEA